MNSCIAVQGVRHSISFCEALRQLVIPTFNSAHRLRRAIDSTLNQAHRDVEVIVVDDGSTDTTQELVQSICATDARLRYVHQARAGVSAARNRGLALATGEFISLLDSDDEWYPWKLAARLACLRSVPDAGMLWTDMDAVGPHGTVVQQKYLKPMYGAYQRLGERMLFNRHWPAQAKAVRLGPHKFQPRGPSRFRSPPLSEGVIADIPRDPAAW